MLTEQLFGSVCNCVGGYSFLKSHISLEQFYDVEWGCLYCTFVYCTFHFVRFAIISLFFVIDFAANP